MLWQLLLTIFGTANAALQVKTTEVSLGQHFAKTLPWTMRPSGTSFTKPSTARRMHSASCVRSGEDRMIVASNHHVEFVAGDWTESQGLYDEVAIGRVSEYKINTDGTATLVSNTALE